MMTQAAKIEILPLLSTLLGMAVLIGLGIWQVQRLQWKEGLIAQTKLPPVTISRAADLNQTPNFRRASLSGAFLPETDILVQLVFGTGHVYRAFALNDGAIIWINAGSFQTFEYKDGLFPPLSHAGHAGNATGLLARAPKPSLFKPANDLSKREFFSARPDEMGQVYNLTNVQPYILYLETPDHPSLTAFQPELRNNHLQYAIFWFVMAGSMAIIYGLRFHWPPRSGAD